MTDDYQQKIQQAFSQLSETWDQSVIPQLQAFIKIPNKSPYFDAKWEEHGYMQQAVQLISDWCHQQDIRDITIEQLQLPGRTPLLLIDIPGDQADHPVLLYGHLDKQPEMRGWRQGLGPWQPVLTDGKLYGRGAADDGYAVFSAMTAISLLQQLDIPHARCVIIIEASEESGSPDLPAYIEKYHDRLGQPSLVIGLDSSCGNYQQLWGTTSLRGIIDGTLSIEVLRHGIHSGYAGGATPSAITILRQLLDRIEDSCNQKVHLPALNTPVPDEIRSQAQAAAESYGETLIRSLPFLDHTQPLTDNNTELLLNRCWHPSLAITGIEGLPDTSQAGSVIIPNLKAKLSVRTPPDCDPQQAMQALTQTLEADPPYGAKITFVNDEHAAGWLAPPLEDWLANANNQASTLIFNKPAAYLGEGGSIPFMGMLAKQFPQAQFLITGVLGPGSNAHGPNEFLHIDMAKRLTACVASIIAAHHQRPR